MSKLSEEMNSILYKEFLDKSFPDMEELKAFIYMHGIEGLLNDFENWLLENKHLKELK